MDWPSDALGLLRHGILSSLPSLFFVVQIPGVGSPLSIVCHVRCQSVGIVEHTKECGDAAMGLPHAADHVLGQSVDEPLDHA